MAWVDLGPVWGRWGGALCRETQWTERAWAGPVGGCWAGLFSVARPGGARRMFCCGGGVTGGGVSGALWGGGGGAVAMNAFKVGGGGVRARGSVDMDRPSVIVRSGAPEHTSAGQTHFHRIPNERTPSSRWSPRHRHFALSRNPGPGSWPVHPGDCEGSGPLSPFLGGAGGRRPPGVCSPSLPPPPRELQRRANERALAHARLPVRVMRLHSPAAVVRSFLHRCVGAGLCAGVQSPAALRSGIPVRPRPRFGSRGRSSCRVCLAPSLRPAPPPCPPAAPRIAPPKALGRGHGWRAVQSGHDCEGAPFSVSEVGA